ncbi:MAG TPA: hypothetical protein PLP61_12855 [Nocardioides sp.]|uniref:hypothetical protein n=1 Tax=Nocardioides sp. TaxID=35761 RepID=UPI002BAC080E|nr:hypothetical protein [Nocardioides sp.]HQR27921.1 hypothetical protein [Nocardioides sp.]
MNQQHHDEGQRLGRALHEQVDSMTQAPLGLDDVRSRARTLQRRRRIAVGVGMLAAAGILVPTALVVGDGGPGGTDPGYATGGPSPSVSTGPSPTIGPVPAPTQDFDVSDLPTGAAPALAWADGLTLHRADGSTVTVKGVDRIHQLAAMGDGWVVATDDGQGNLEAVRLAADGTAGDRYPLDGDLATSPEGQVVAWASPTGEVTVVQSGGTETLTLPRVPGAGPYSAAAVTSEDCVEGRTTDAGCSVLVTTTGARPQTWVSTSHGLVDRLGGGIRTLTAYRSFYAGITEYHPDLTTCSQLQDEPGVTRWQTCDFRLVGFSPDNEHLVAVGSIGDGFGDGELAILDATGTPRVHLLSSRDSFAFSLGQVWEDDSHVLTVTYQDGRWAVVRVGLDGSMEYAVPPVAGSDADRPFFLQVR